MNQRVSWLRVEPLQLGGFAGCLGARGTRTLVPPDAWDERRAGSSIESAVHLQPLPVKLPVCMQGATWRTARGVRPEAYGQRRTARG